MRGSILMPVVFACLLANLAHAQDGRPAIYPFDVTVGGQLAKVTDEFPVCARVEKPVAADAKIKLALAPGMIVINATPANEKGEIDPAGKTSIIVAEETDETSLDRTMDKSRLPPGTYMMNIVAGGTTSRVLFTVSPDTAPRASPEP